MIPPGALVMLSPVVVGVLFGTRTLAGLLAGALVSGVQMAVSMSNTGGAWDNAKKYVEVSLAYLRDASTSQIVRNVAARKSSPWASVSASQWMRC